MDSTRRNQYTENRETCDRKEEEIMLDGKYRVTKEIHLTDPDYDNTVILHISSGGEVEIRNGRLKLSDRTVPEDWMKGYEEYFERAEDEQNEI